ncbi:MAG: hypothetical protein OEX04_10305 [Acidimicrobiia bacterium]|nr:hypothetical protein [Acidimicrobiia bacterium]MDH4307862.1 hypothetical protein [Acidimicrobiia bacterium]
MSILAVLVHGLGANAHDFWGSTPEALCDSDALRPDVEIKFWGYETTARPRPVHRVLRPLGMGSPLESVDSLGEHLLSRLRGWYRDGHYDEVKLLGHSMGGLVVAAAVGRALEENRSADQGLIDTLSAVAFVATPLGGAKLAGRASPLFGLFGRNVHRDDLDPGSKSRARVVNRFIGQAVRSGRVPLTIFRASNDQVVEPDELDEPFAGDTTLSYRREVLSGTHSGCVQNLAPGSDDLRALVRWVNGDRLSADDIVALAERGEPISVFVSRPTDLNARQQAFWVALEASLAEKGLRVRTLGVTDEPQEEGGMYDVVRLLRQCDGALILGMSQATAEKVVFKEGTDNLRTETRCAFVTPWNHMEACMAFAHELPLLVIREQVVQGEGVLDRSALRVIPHKTDLDPSWLAGRGRGPIDSWVQNVAERAAGHRS